MKTGVTIKIVGRTQFTGFILNLLSVNLIRFIYLFIYLFICLFFGVSLQLKKAQLFVLTELAVEGDQQSTLIYA